MGLFAGNSNQRIEFVRMKGPQGKGHAEMAVTKPKGESLSSERLKTIKTKMYIFMCLSVFR